MWCGCYESPIEMCAVRDLFGGAFGRMFGGHQSSGHLLYSFYIGDNSCLPNKYTLTKFVCKLKLPSCSNYEHLHL